jgi:polar amino acid transport system ATP-binding protein
MMFDQGQVLEEGVPEKLFTEPEHERTREFLRAVIERA